MLIAIAGPTAVGKSALALSLAQTLNGEILCADSRQIYKDLDIGTAKPSLAEQALVPHHLFDIANLRETYTVAQYRQAAETAIAEVQSRGKIPILVGGTGLYFRTLLYDYQIPKVEPQVELRQRLEAQEAASPGSLHQQLQLSDPLTASKFHPNDTRRIVRALEVQAVTGQGISHWQGRSEGLQHNCLYVALHSPKELLYQRIQQRIDVMIQEGLFDEVQALRQQYGADLPLLKTLNYIESAQFLDQKITLDQAKEAMFIHTRQYAKRQMTWFRRDAEIQWQEVTGQESLERIQNDLLAQARDLVQSSDQISGQISDQNSADTSSQHKEAQRV